MSFEINPNKFVEQAKKFDDWTNDEQNQNNALNGNFDDIPVFKMEGITQDTYDSDIYNFSQSYIDLYDDGEKDGVWNKDEFIKMATGGLSLSEQLAADAQSYVSELYTDDIFDNGDGIIDNAEKAAAQAYREERAKEYEEENKESYEQLYNQLYDTLNIDGNDGITAAEFATMLKAADSLDDNGADGQIDYAMYQGLTSLSPDDASYEMIQELRKSELDSTFKDAAPANTIDTVFKDDERLKEDENGNKYVTVEAYGTVKNGNDCISRIINNNYDLKAMGMTYQEVEKAVMDANPDIYGTEAGGGRNRIFDGSRHNSVLYTGDKIILPQLQASTPVDTQPTDTQATTPTGAPEDAAPTGTPESTAPTGAPESTAPTGDPQAAAPTGDPEGAAPTGAPEDTAPTGTPEDAAPTGVPEDAAPTGAPEGAAPTGTTPPVETKDPLPSGVTDTPIHRGYYEDALKYPSDTLTNEDFWNSDISDLGKLEIVKEAIGKNNITDFAVLSTIQSYCSKTYLNILNTAASPNTAERLETMRNSLTENGTALIQLDRKQEMDAIIQMYQNIKDNYMRQGGMGHVQSQLKSLQSLNHFKLSYVADLIQEDSGKTETANLEKLANIINYQPTISDKQKSNAENWYYKNTKYGDYSSEPRNVKLEKILKDTTLSRGEKYYLINKYCYDTSKGTFIHDITDKFRYKGNRSNKEFKKYNEDYVNEFLSVLSGI